MFKQVIQRFVHKKKKPHKMSKKTVRNNRNLFRMTFLQIYQLKSCKHAHFVPAAFWPKPRAGLGLIANRNHQHLVLLLFAPCECATVLTVSLE